MQSRMDRYNTNHEQIKTRSQKNSALYDDVRNSMLSNFDINSNVSIITNETDDVIDMTNVKRFLDKKYGDNVPRRKSIAMPLDIQEEMETKEQKDIFEDTKEYDINSIIEKAKQGKNVDYTKERLKKVRETQYEILNNLNLEEKKNNDEAKTARQKDEENLMNLINTITQLELNQQNSDKEYSKKRVSADLDLLSDLSDEKEKTRITITEDKDEDTSINPIVDEKDYQNDFSDISYADKSTLIIKIIIFIVIIVLIAGAIYIVNNVLDLGLF